MRKNILKPVNLLILAFFTGYLISGFLAYDDYGVNWDERIMREGIGEANYNYVVKNDQAIFADVLKYYGPVFEVFLVMVEKQFSLTDTRDIFLMRHIVTFLFFFSGVVVFFFLCRKLFKNDILALVACAMLVLSPHIYSHSFHNSKDLPFLTFCLMSLATLYWLQYKPTWYAVLIHALTCALAIDTRVLGLLIPLFTVVLLLMDHIIEKNTSLVKLITVLFSYSLITTLFVITFWPFLWPDPLHNFKEAFDMMSRFTPFDRPNLYMGEYILPNALPWHYVPVWMAITLPVVYSSLFIAGAAGLIKRCMAIPFKVFYGQYKFHVSVFLFFIAPIAAVILFNSILYDGWRHLFFVYPAFVIIAIFGLQWLYYSFDGIIVKRILVLLMSVSFIVTGSFMIRNHPYQNVYFNFLAGDMPNAKENFEMDYWGLSYRNALEYLLEHDDSPKIKYNSANDPGFLGRLILAPAQRKRLEYVSRIEDCEYFLSEYRWHKHSYPFQEYYSIEVGGAKIMTIFKMK